VTKDTTTYPKVPYEALQALVCDHGDAFRWSLSKRGRIWLSLTHWDTARYNTAVEIPAGQPYDTFWKACAVLCYAHAHKCFQGYAQEDTWFSGAAVGDAYNVALDWLGAHPTFTVEHSDGIEPGTEPDA